MKILIIVIIAYRDDIISVLQTKNREKSVKNNNNKSNNSIAQDGHIELNNTNNTNNNNNNNNYNIKNINEEEEKEMMEVVKCLQVLDTVLFSFDASIRPQVAWLWYGLPCGE